MGAKLFVGNLNPTTSKQQLTEFFTAAGRVASVMIPVDRDTGKPRGFCFVEFADRDAAEQAFAVCDGRELEGRKVRLSWAREIPNDRGRRSPDTKWSQGDQPNDRMPDDRRRDRDRYEANDDAYYGGPRRRRTGRHGRHGSDRKRNSGTRRRID